jgi:hypothetical protein
VTLVHGFGGEEEVALFSGNLDSLGGIRHLDILVG